MTACSKAERRQVFDLPTELRLQVTEHRIGMVTCPCCGQENQGQFPSGVEQPVQYVPHFSSLCLYLQHYHLLPFARLSALLSDLFGPSAALSQGTLWNLTRRCHEALAPVQESIRSALSQGALLHCDETGMRIGKRLSWLHVCCTDRLTDYAWHTKRGKAALQEIGILPAFAGTCVHDGFSSYFAFSQCQHALCGAHLLRDLTFTQERFGPAGAWAEQMKDLLLTMKEAADKAKARALVNVLSIPGFGAYQERYDAILRMGYGVPA